MFRINLEFRINPTVSLSFSRFNLYKQRQSHGLSINGLLSSSQPPVPSTLQKTAHAPSPFTAHDRKEVVGSRRRLREARTKPNRGDDVSGGSRAAYGEDDFSKKI